MSALSNVRDTPVRTADMREGILLTNIKVYKGALVVRDTATGFDKPGVTGTGLVTRGIADMSEPYVDMTGLASGSSRIQLLIGVALLANDGSIAAANRGATCFVVDDQTVALTDGGGTRSVAGTIEDVDSRGVWVRVGSVDGNALATEITSRQAITTNLASTVNAKGASLVGIENSPAGEITATTVQGALVELIDARRIAKTADTGIGTMDVNLRITVADGSTVLDALTLDATFGAIVVTDVKFIKTTATGGASDAVQLCTDVGGATAVSSSLALNTIAAGGVVRTTSVTNASFAAGAHLYVKRTHTTDCSGTLIVSGYRA